MAMAMAIQIQTRSVCYSQKGIPQECRWAAAQRDFGMLGIQSAPGQAHLTGSDAGACQQASFAPTAQALQALSTPLARSKFSSGSFLPARLFAEPSTSGHEAGHEAIAYSTTIYRWHPSGGPGACTDTGPNA